MENHSEDKKIPDLDIIFVGDDVILNSDGIHKSITEQFKDVPDEVKQLRAQEVMEVQQEISYEKNQEKIGQVFKVLIDKKEAGRYLGRTEFDSVEVDNEVVIHATKKLVIGDFVQVKITKAYDYDLEGKVI